MAKLKVLLADDHSLFRDGIASLLTAWGMVIIGQAANGVEAVEKAKELNPDLILMDINMPELNGLEATRQIKNQHPNIKVVILTASEEDEHLFEAIKSGAQGYLLKNIQSQEFNELIIGLARGEAAISKILATKILKEFAHQSEESVTKANDKTDEQLTPREKEVLVRLSEGLSNKKIAAKLNVSENTVKFHVRNILSKLHLSSRTQAATYAVRENITRNSDK